ncbi:MAG: lysophospholipid acyltransferase family protein [Candidatus Omnitrophica bacterium]|nr:lysophospholipid acyltransferase family protein [Candidatus Omnitrophota bacterium]
MYLFFKIGRFLSLRLRLKTCYKLAVFFADVYYFFARNERKNMEENLRIVLDISDQHLIKKHIKNTFRNFAKYLVDFFRFSMLSRQYILNYVKVEGKEILDKALAEGRGVIAVSAHIGNWELGAAILASFGYPIHAIALEHEDKRVNDFFLEQRSFADVRIISMGSELRKCFNILKGNMILAIAGDRDFSNHGITATFFGRPTILPRGPAVFNMKTNAPIIPTFLIREKDDTFKFCFEEPIKARLTGDKRKDIKETVESYVSVIEKYVRAYPDQWYVFRKVWNNSA